MGKIPKNRKGCMIRRVFPLVRKEAEHHYNPNLISIGPLHRNNEALKRMEVLKWNYLRQLIRRNPERNKLENYVNKVHSVKEEAMKFYSDPDELELGTRDFVEMMVLDGCFLIEYLVKNYLGENRRLLDDWNPLLLRRDLLLVENQIPFSILEVLFDSSDIPDLVGLKDDGDSITLMQLVVSYATRNRFESVSPIPDPIVHLLHVYHECLRPTPNKHDKTYTLAKKMRRIRRLAAAPFFFLLACLLTCKIPANFFRGHRRRGFIHPRVRREIPSATELYNSGVNFKNKKGTQSFVDTTFESFVDTTFDNFQGILEIPMFLVSEASISTLCNLTAFEQMHPTATIHITSHAALMSSLIRTAEDVAILKDNGIIHSNLKDVQVVELFYHLYKHSNINFESHHYRPLFTDVWEYCNVSHNKWRADFKHTYFASPWTTASLIAATFILLLTSVQTFYTIYAYHHPPS